MQGFDSDWLEKNKARVIVESSPSAEDASARIGPSLKENSTTLLISPRLHQAIEAAAEPVVRHKFSAKEAHSDGIRFSSKLERDFYDYLTARVAAGEAVFLLRQVPFHLPGGTRLVVDFQVFWADGTVEFLDSKGVETDSFKIKKREIEAVFPVVIRPVGRKDFKQGLPWKR
jgi:hypothetical protein